MQRVDLGDLALEWNQLNVACRIRETFVPDGLLIGIPLDRGSVTLLGRYPAPAPQNACGDDALQHAATVVVAREHILSGLIPALATWNADGKEPNKTARSHYWPLIKQAEALMWAGQSPASSDSMAELLGISRRTLFHAFRTSLGMGPYQFDRLIRLHQLRQALIDALPESRQVTTLAVEHGFSHLGRLSVDYRDLFGESPRMTLGRAQTVSH